MVLSIKDSAHLEEQLTAAGDKLVVIDFYATWCGPCKVIAPKIDEYSEEFPDVIFVKVDVDECDDIAVKYNVNSMPTFLFIKNNTMLETVVGANAGKIKTTIEKHRLA
ncbi:thioredoxin-2-like [Leptopilina boulardi]|uniref:thioredoxin-2-like n=1 Tax=Leptopilina boulardi TaxID=63433 RepID=UPI0021F4FFF4|nr:thioredoxin-2-like [Leptopilina boulardi]